MIFLCIQDTPVYDIIFHSLFILQAEKNILTKMFLQNEIFVVYNPKKKL